MATRHPFPGKLEKNLLEVAAQQGAVRIYNGHLDKAGGIHKRPGLLLNQHVAAPGQIQAIYYWPSQGKIVAVVGGNLWSADSLSSALVKVNKVGNTLAPGIAKIVDTGRWLYICSAGGRMLQWNGDDPAVYVEDDVAPKNVSSIVTLNQRVIANELGTNKFWYTQPPALADATAALVWDGYVELGRNNEDIVGLAVSNGELIAFKRDILQAYYDDATTPYKPIIGSQRKFGLINANAIASFQDATFFVTPDRVIRLLQNREISDVSTREMELELAKIRIANTVISFELDKRVLFTFPDEDKTYVYDPLLRSWSNYTSHDNGLEKVFLATGATVLPAAGATDFWVIGGNDGNLYFWDASAYNDAGVPIRFMVRTTHFDWGSLNRKQSTRLVVKVSTEPLRDEQTPAIDFPHAVRCELYNYTVELPVGTTATITGLPAGFTTTTVPGSVNITGSTTDYTGSVQITITITDSRGAVYQLQKTFTVDDTPSDIVIGVL